MSLRRVLRQTVLRRHAHGDRIPGTVIAERVGLEVFRERDDASGLLPYRRERQRDRQPRPCGFRRPMGRQPHSTDRWHGIRRLVRALRQELIDGNAPEADFDALFREQREIVTQMLSSGAYADNVGAFEGAS